MKKQWAKKGSFPSAAGALGMNVCTPAAQGCKQPTNVQEPEKITYTMITKEPNRENTKVFESEILPSIVLLTSIGDSKSFYFPR